MDWRIRRARILDGSGNPWYRGDVGIEDGRVVAIGDLTGNSARTDVDAGDNYLAPGFIDVHTHSDFTIQSFPRAESMISQGVTTEVMGNCGLTPHPVDSGRLDLLRQYLSFMGGNLSYEWRSTGEFLREIEGLPLSHNLLTLIGHGSIRLAVMGFDQRRPTVAEMDRMKGYVADAMEAGVVGMSSGLIYVPGSFGDTEELIELCQVAGRFGGIYTTHLRNEADDLLGAVGEALDIGERAGVPVQLSHHKVMGERNWGKVGKSLAMADAARTKGQDVTMDQYPYTGSSTTFTAFVPDWAMEGGVSALLDRVKDPVLRARIAEEMDATKPMGWDRVVVASCRKAELRKYEGLTIEEVGKAMGTAPVDAGLDMLLIGGQPFSIVRFGMTEEDVETVMRHPNVMVGSDGNALAPTSRGKPHPRSYGTFARVLGRYVRQEGNLSLSDAVRKMTSLPAQRFGLWDRGLVRPGFAADLVLFDPSRIEDTATFSDPHQYAEGIHWVMVGGEVVWDQGRDTGALAGTVLKPLLRH